MNKDAFAMFKSVVDKFEELEINRIMHENDNDMYFLNLSNSDKNHIIQTNIVKARKYFADWRERGFKEYGKVND